MTTRQHTAETLAATPAAALVLGFLFFAGVGIWYCITNRKKIRRWIRRTIRKKHFWGYVLAAGLFILFGGYFLYLGFDDR